MLLSELLLQIQSFVLTAVLGVVAGMVFQFYQLLVRRARVGKYSLYVMDFFLWMLMILLIFAAMLFINQGEMRVYVLIALVVGIIIYHHYLGPTMEGPISTLAQLTITAVSFLFGIIKRPVLALSNWLKGLIKRGKGPPPSDKEED
jgi:spore cortex biosynthesis protein YabQ